MTLWINLLNMYLKFVKKYILWTHVTSPLFNEKDYIHFLISFLKGKKLILLQKVRLVQT